MCDYSRGVNRLVNDLVILYYCRFSLIQNIAFNLILKARIMFLVHATGSSITLSRLIFYHNETSKIGIGL